MCAMQDRDPMALHCTVKEQNVRFARRDPMRLEATRGSAITRPVPGQLERC